MKYLFQTEHLRIKRFEAEDAKQLYENHSEEEMKQWIPNESYESLEEAAEAIVFYQGYMDEGRLPYVLAVEHRESGELIGDTGVNEVEGAPGEVEIGYSICHRYSGLGYATELLEAMTFFVKEVFRVQVLYGRVMKGNEASVKVLEKCGYVFLREEQEAEDDPYGQGMLVFGREVAGTDSQ